MNIVRLWVPVCLVGLVVGCGQKGPLVLPDAPKHKKAAPASSPTPAATNSPSDATPKP